VSQSTFFYGSVVVLAALLFLPTTRFIWVLSVRRLERKLERPLSEAERLGQHNRARIIALFVVIVFSLLFNASTLGLPRGG